MRNAPGTLTLFKDIFVPVAPPTKQRKGRSKELFQKRNECLVDRYWYYGRTSEKRYDVILKTLSGEFFLSEYTIAEIINDNYVLLKKVNEKKPEKSYFSRKWTHLVW